MRSLPAVLLLASSLLPRAVRAEAAPGSPWPAGSLQQEEVALGVLLVHLDPAAAAKAPVAVARLAPKHLPGLRPVEIGKDERPRPGALSWFKGEDSFGEDELRYFASRVDPEVRARLAGTHPVTFLAVRGPAARDRTLRGFTALVGALAGELGAVVYDLDTRDLWSAGRWKEERVGGLAGEVPEVERVITLHNYRAQGGIRSVTLGMSKLGLPDVVVEDGQTQSTATVDLVLAVCQWMVERRALAAPGRIPLDLRKLGRTPLRDRLLAKPGHGAVGAAEVRVAVGRREEGDAANRLMAITFEGAPGNLGERQMALLTRLFGDSGTVSYAPASDAALAAASLRARAALPRFKQAFAARKVGERFLVKMPFRSGGETEYMWLEVKAWDGQALEGVLQDEPYVIRTVRRGARLTVKEEEIYDWLLQRADGTSEGNETTKVLERREGE